jgi:hypothetical protein
LGEVERPMGEGEEVEERVNMSFEFHRENSTPATVASNSGKGDARPYLLQTSSAFDPHYNK